MSRIGKLKIIIPEGVLISLSGNKIKVSGPGGELERSLPSRLKVTLKEKEISLLPKGSLSSHLWGLWRTLISNMIEGVTSGFRKELEILGVGYKAEKRDEDLLLHLGFSHPIVVKPKEGIKFEISKNKIIVSGIDKEQVSNMAAYIRSFKKPEPYKGKGIRYVGEKVRKKAGKTTKVIAT